MKLHGIILLLVFIVKESFSNVANGEKIEFCSQLKCSYEDAGEQVCGLRVEGEGFRLKLFQDECELLKYGCSVDEAMAYGLINKVYCDRSFETNYNETVDYTKNESQKLENSDGRKFKNTFFYNVTNKCGLMCDNNEKKEVCGIRKDVNGYRIRLFQNYCDLIEHNCENDLEFMKTDLFICKTDLKNKTENNIKNNNAFNKNILNNLFKNTFEDSLSKYTVDVLDKVNTPDYKDKYEVKANNVKNLVVVNSKIFGQYDNINDSIDTFFAASHVFDLPLTEIKLNTRRKFLKYAGPVSVFVPWISKPKIIHNDTFHRPTLSSCYHKCPYKCPDTYAPVCGVPGVVAREPSLMFQNHCFMDVAQCKMFWENKSPTSRSSSYVESSFLFCMGDEMNAVYRFLPAIRTLQHMGRLKKKGKFRAVMRNFRFVSDFRYGRPKFMG